MTKLEITGIAWGVNLASVVINTIGIKAISRMNSFNVWWTVGDTLVLVITLLVKAPERVSFSPSIIISRLEENPVRILRVLCLQTMRSANPPLFADHHKLMKVLVLQGGIKRLRCGPRISAGEFDDPAENLDD